MATTQQVVTGNRINTTLASALSTSSTTVSLVSVANFPTIATGQFCALVISSVTTPANFEIVYVTALSGTSATVQRAQEGTSAQAFNPGDIVQGDPTAGVFALQAQLNGTNTWSAAQTFDGAVALVAGGTSVTPASTDRSQNIATTAFTTGRLINIRVFGTAGNSTYTPTTGTSFIYVELVGGGGGGGGAATTGASQCSAGAGGGAGGWARKRITSGFSGVTITVGAGGAAAAGAGGTTGGTSAFSSIFSATGGTGGTLGSAQPTSTANFVGNGSGGVGVSGDSVATGGAGFPGFYAALPLGGKGGMSFYGEGGEFTSAPSSGNVGPSPGSGGSGGSLAASAGSAATGGQGAAGQITIYEFS